MAATNSVDDSSAARDGAQLFVRRFEPGRGVAQRFRVHLVHGMAEHSGRYRPFASFLAASGAVVTVHDQRGAGQTAEQPGALGLGHLGSQAVDALVEDLAELISDSCVRYVGLPLLLFGHSLGTIVSQLCAGSGRAGSDLLGLALSGVPTRVPWLSRTAFKTLLAAVRLVRGGSAFAALTEQLTFGKYNKRCLAALGDSTPAEPSGHEWLCRDPQEVDKYLKDPHCGQQYDLDFYSSTLDALGSLSAPEAHAQLPSTLPVLVLLGSEDFCAIDDGGAYSFVAAREELRSACKPSPKVIIYPGARHELLQELNRTEVMEDISHFFEACFASALHSAL